MAVRTSVLVTMLMLTAFIIGLTLHTPPQDCAADPVCAKAPGAP